MQLLPRKTSASALFLLLAGCGGEPPALYGDRSGGNGGGGGDVGGPKDCSTPCKCADRGPPDYSREALGKPSPTSDEEQKAALLRGNHWRTVAGLDPLNAVDLIETAATAHANFLVNNDRMKCSPGAHDENPACPGFTGNMPWDRMKAAGYDYATASEIIDWEPTAERAVDMWIWTPYHRLPFMSWGLPDTGFGYASGGGGRADVMDFGLAKGASAKPPSKPALFPAPGQEAVETSFSGRESPTPPEPPTGWPSGTVISMHFASGSWTVDEHHVYSTEGGKCAELEHVFISKDNDDVLKGGNDIFMYPHKPLANSTEYVASVTGTLGGMPFTRTWAFRTR